jgi:glycosyltransferase involved in cell wall biosynthesis
MKILQVIPVFSALFGGPVTVVRSICKELSKRHEVTVYTTAAVDKRRDFKEFPVEDESEGYRIVYFPRILKLCGFNISPAMGKTLRESISKYDVVHLHSWRQFQDITVHRYAKKCNVPYILQVHGSLPRIGDWRRLKWIYDVFFGHRLLRDASKVIALSNAEAEQYKAMGVPEWKIAIIPNGIDLSEYAELPPKGSFKRRFNIPEDKKIILYLGRIHKTKGIDLLIKAYAYLINKMKCKHALLVIAGPDDGYLDDAKALANSLGIYTSVIFTGFISDEDKLKALVDAEVFVTPSFYGFPLTFLEACAVGTPIVTTILGDKLEWIDNNVGYVSRPTPTDLAEAIYRIVFNEELHRRFSKNCIEIVNSKFPIEKVVEKLEKVYAEIVEG